MTVPNGKAVMSPNSDEMVRAQAIIQSLERMCTESRTRELHKDAAIAVLQDQLTKSQREMADMKAKAEAKTVDKPAKGAGSARNGKGAHTN